MSEGATTSGDMAGADRRIGEGPSRRTVKNVKKMSRTRFKDFRMKTKKQPSKKEKEARKRHPKHKGKLPEEE